MEKKYLKYSLEELLDDRQFVAWILKGHNKTEWNSFIHEYPEFKSEVKKAEEIILLLKDTYEILDEEDVVKMWHNIDRFNKTYGSVARRIQLRRTFAIAASVLIVVSMGFIGYSYFHNRNVEYQFVSSNVPGDQEDARLILSGGEQVDLKQDNSTIEIDEKEKITINNEDVIDQSGNEDKDNDNLQMNEVIVPYGKSSELLLADGTRVWINAGSRLAFPTKFTKDTREVYLEGEACFKVAKNASQPFIVNANKLGIRVLGTYFDVSAYPNDENIETILVEGSVLVGKKSSFGMSQTVELKPYQKATFNKEEKEIIVLDEPDAEVYLAWTEGWFQFSHQNLEKVLAKIERYYNVNVIVQNEAFPKEGKITGKLDLKDSLDEVLTALSDVIKMDYRIDGNKVYINKKIERIPMK
ncbi:FecR family protein [Maribellus sediminis]|uniref:FecR family protein n=1 Tax=Maribellus sediminis TaxID=2696285 RepID=UPI0014307ED2|nr:FecR domain-containing protein [Maribellus sediminis]